MRRWRKQPGNHEPPVFETRAFGAAIYADPGIEKYCSDFHEPAQIAATLRMKRKYLNTPAKAGRPSVTIPSPGGTRCTNAHIRNLRSMRHRQRATPFQVSE